MSNNEINDTTLQSPSDSVSSANSFDSKHHGNLGKRMKKARRCAKDINKPFRCNYKDCTKTFGTVTNLNLHIRLKQHGTMRSIKEFKEEIISIQTTPKSIQNKQAVTYDYSRISPTTKKFAFLLTSLRFDNNMYNQ